MRRFLIFLLFIPVFLMALESEPSEVVGYVKYELGTTSSSTNLNVIALPMDTEITNITELADEIGNVDLIGVWDPLSQNWLTSSLLFGTWEPNTALNPNDIVIVSVTGDIDYYCAGSLPSSAQYNLITTASNTNLNTIMIPLNRSDIIDVNSLATSIGNVDLISIWDSALQKWVSSSYLFGSWEPNTSLEISTPVMVSVTSNVTWPTRSYGSSVTIETTTLSEGDK